MIVVVVSVMAHQCRVAYGGAVLVVTLGVRGLVVRHHLHTSVFILVVILHISFKCVTTGVLASFGIES